MALLAELSENGFVFKGKCSTCTTTVKNKYESPNFPAVQIVIMPAYNSFYIKHRGRQIFKGGMVMLREGINEAKELLVKREQENKMRQLKFKTRK